MTDKMSVARLYESKMVTLTQRLFEERHCRRSPLPAITPAFVIEAYRSLGLIDQPWPKQQEANAVVLQVQAELDRLYDQQERNESVAMARTSYGDY